MPGTGSVLKEELKNASRSFMTIPVELNERDTLDEVSRVSYESGSVCVCMSMICIGTCECPSSLSNSQRVQIALIETALLFVLQGGFVGRVLVHRSV